MKSQNEILKQIAEAQHETERYKLQEPAEHRFQVVADELDRIGALVRSQWPLQEKIKEEIWLGLYAVRELETGYPNLADLLMEISYDLKHN